MAKEQIMSEQRFPAGQEPQVLIGTLKGDLEVSVWDGEEILVLGDAALRDLRREGDAVIFDADDDLELRVPARCAIQVDQGRGDIEIEGVDRVRLLHVQGDVELESIGVQVEIQTLSGDLDVDGAPLVICSHAVSGDVDLSRVQRVELETVGGDLDVEGLSEALQCRRVGSDADITSAGAVSLTLDRVGSDLDVRGGAALLQCNDIGGDCCIEDGEVTLLALGNVGGDLEVERVGVIRVAHVGSDCAIDSFSEALELGSISGDCRIDAAGGSVEIGNIGGDCSIGMAARGMLLGNIGGDCAVAGVFPAGSTTRANVGGDARIGLPTEPNLQLQAVVGGSVRGPEALAGGLGNRISVTYGEGAATCELQIGGDLHLSEGSPRSWSSQSSRMGEFGREMGEFGREMGEFGREMGAFGRDLGRELGKLGRELAAEISAAFASEGNQRGSEWANTIAEKIDQKTSRLQERIAAQTQAAGSDPRLRVKINEREWQLDPERLERIKEQARRAAAEGLSGAMEAVERALSRIRVPDAPMAPPAPAAPEPPHPPAATGQTIRIETELEPVTAPAPTTEAANPPEDEDSEQQRETILRMIAEGRISPEEGDLLLEALASRS
jgi:hypothetical protein